MAASDWSYVSLWTREAVSLPSEPLTLRVGYFPQRKLRCWVLEQQRGQIQCCISANGTNYVRAFLSLISYSRSKFALSLPNHCHFSILIKFVTITNSQHVGIFDWVVPEPARQTASVVRRSGEANYTDVGQSSSDQLAMVYTVLYPSLSSL